MSAALPETQSFIHALSEQFVAGEEHAVLCGIASLLQQTAQARSRQLDAVVTQQKGLKKKADAVRQQVEQAERAHLQLDHAERMSRLTTQQADLQRQLLHLQTTTRRLEQECDSAEQQLQRHRLDEQEPTVDEVGLRLKIYQSLGFDLQQQQQPGKVKCRVRSAAGRNVETVQLTGGGGDCGTVQFDTCNRLWALCSEP